MKVSYVNLAAQHRPIKQQLLDAVERVLDHGQFILGEEVSQFEERFASLCDATYAVGVNSGTDALILALKALGIGPGDEVITVPNSFVASTGCIAHAGATPVFVDVRPDYNMDPDLIEGAITPKTRAILPVHLTGRPAPMDSIMEIASKHGLYVIEDCAQAVCAEYQGRRVGSWGHVGCFSLHPLKTLNACGDGGVLTTNDTAVFQELKVLRNLGLRTRDDCTLWGHNSRLDTIQAAMLLVKLEHMDRWTEQRRGHAASYQGRLAGNEQVVAPRDAPDENCVYHTFVIQAELRDGLKSHLTKNGISTAIHYPVPIHLQPAAADMGHTLGDFPETERQAQCILSLPVYPELQADQIDWVADCINSFYDGK